MTAIITVSWWYRRALFCAGIALAVYACSDLFGPDSSGKSSLKPSFAVGDVTVLNLFQGLIETTFRLRGHQVPSVFSQEPGIESWCRVG